MGGGTSSGWSGKGARRLVPVQDTMAPRSD